MAITSKSPWWLSLAYFGGLFSVFFGQRALAHTDGPGTLFTIVGVALLVAATGFRVVLFAGAGISRDRKRIELLTLLCYVGGLVALALFALTTESGHGVVGLADAASSTITRFDVPTTVVWTIVMACSVIPLGMLELGMGFDRSQSSNDGEDAGLIEAFRVRQMAGSGLTVALAMSLLMVTCQVAQERNIRIDASYFKTSSPGEATINIVQSLSEPIDVILFYPDVNEVKEEVRLYFEDLAAKTGKIRIEEIDHMVSPEVAKQYKVHDSGTIALVKRGPDVKDAKKDSDDSEKPEKSKDKAGAKDTDTVEKIKVSPQIKRARASQLRTLDEKVQAALLKVIRAKRIAYLTKGHGELNDPDSIGQLGLSGHSGQRIKATLIKTALKRLNYQVKDLTAFDLTGGVPDDATMVISLSPMQSFSGQEETALSDYLGTGGALLLALDPRSPAILGEALSGRLGVQFNNTYLADDKNFVPQRFNKGDHGYLKTNQFSSHASVTTLSRRSSSQALLLVRPGHLEDAKFTGAGAPKRTYVVRSMQTAFNDIDGNFVFNKGTEKRKRYNIAAAIEDSKATKEHKKGDAAPPREGMRAMVIADAEVFADELLKRVPLLGDLIFDSLKWLGGEEQFSGHTESEKDVKIEHTKSQDVAWFYATMILPPLLVMFLGLGYIRLRNRRRRRA